MKKIVLTGILTTVLGAFSFAQTENNTTKQEPTRKLVSQPKKVATVKEVVPTKPAEEVKPVENKEVEPIRTRQELRPAPKAVSTVKPVEKTEKTVE